MYVRCHYMIEAWDFLLILQGLTIKRSSWVSEEILNFQNNVEIMKDYGNFGSCSKCIFLCYDRVSGGGVTNEKCWP